MCPFSLELASDLAVQCLLVLFVGQKNVAPLDQAIEKWSGDAQSNFYSSRRLRQQKGPFTEFAAVVSLLGQVEGQGLGT